MSWYWELVDSKDGAFQDDVWNDTWDTGKSLKVFSYHTINNNHYIWTRKNTAAFEMKITDSGLITTQSGGYNHSLITNKTGFSYIPGSSLGYNSGDPYIYHPGGTTTFNLTPDSGTTLGRGMLLIELENSSAYNYPYYVILSLYPSYAYGYHLFSWALSDLPDGTIDIDWGTTTYAEYVGSNFFDDIFTPIYPNFISDAGNCPAQWGWYDMSFFVDDMLPIYVVYGYTYSYYTIGGYTYDKYYYKIVNEKSRISSTWENEDIYYQLFSSSFTYPEDYLRDSPVSYVWYGTRGGDIDEYLSTILGSIRKHNDSNNSWDFLFDPADRDIDNDWYLNHLSYDTDVDHVEVDYGDYTPSYAFQEIYLIDGSWYMVVKTHINNAGYYLALLKLNAGPSIGRIDVGRSRTTQHRTNKRYSFI